MGCDFNEVARELASTDAEVLSWAITTLTKWFSPGHNQHYTLTRWRLSADQDDVSSPNEQDLDIVARLAQVLAQEVQQ